MGDEPAEPGEPIHIQHHIKKHSDAMQYKYRLRKGSKKEICPSCHRKTFTPYVDESGETLSELVGMCDRKDHCNYHYSPGDYFKDSRAVGGDNRYEKREYTSTESTPKPIPHKMLNASMSTYGCNPLAAYLKNLFGKRGAGEFVEPTLREMAVGSSKRFGGSPVFWLIDHNGHLRDGKIMGYDAQTGRRIKKPFPLFTNVHSILEREQGGNYDNGSCYYGAHQLMLPDEHDTPIWLFESEKGALIVAITLAWGGARIAYPMAAGGCSSFNPTKQAMKDRRHKLQALRNRRVVLFPDEGKFEEWERKGRLLQGFSREVYVSTAMERCLHPHAIPVAIDPGDGFDDLIIRHIEAGIEPFTLLLTSYGYRQTYKIV